MTTQLDKSVLVTGSSRGIGRAIALALADAGFSIVLHCRSKIEQAQEVAAMIEANGGQSRCLQFDISDRATTKEILEKDIAEHGAYYGIVCNAGLTRDTPFPAMTGEDWDQVLHTNLDGFYNIVQPLVMPMIQKRKGGRIVTIASASGVVGNRGQVNYSASKAGLIGATKALSLELAKRKITVNCVAPGLIETDMLTDIMEDKTIKDEMMKLVPARRVGKPEEVAELVKFLFSDAAAYITRQVISVNGGLY